MSILVFVLIALGAYFSGGLNGAIITSRLVYGDDIRQHGSGNAGLTNFQRTYGGQAIFLLVLIDVVKTAAPVILGGMVLESMLDFGTVADRVIIGRTFAGLFAMIGHSYPCLYGFRGGKGILSGGTMVLFLNGYAFLILLAVFLLAVILTRYVSLGSVLAGLALPISFIVLGMNFWATLLALLCGAFVIYRHRENIGRLLTGQERKLSFGKKREERPS
ncbi:MAG: glycerol-3-phosphate 1-O-acyltransferase PlsY [Oscillospiraceae bacterium]|nr:glycerol-3-phosphate 1-O-acyltransferase PlsY [Oscillospiraceae bacterium]